MRVIAILVLLLGIGLAGGAIYFASEYFAAFEARMAKGNQGLPTVAVVVAKVPLAYGTTIDPKKHLRWAEWPADSVPKGAFTDVEKLIGKEGERDKPRAVLGRIEAGEPILEAKVSGFGGDPRLAFNLREGMRAFTIRIDAISGVAGFIAPGDRVDIVLTHSVSGQLTSTVILQSVLVIAVDTNTNQESNRARVGNTATVEVTPKTAQKLLLAQQIGRLSLTLRGVDAHEIAEDESAPEAVNVNDLLGIEEAVAPEPAPERETTKVKIRRGGAIEGEVEFGD